jgi:hypothetical protein
MAKGPDCEIGIDGDGDDRKLRIKIENKREINIRRKKPHGDFDAFDETGKKIEPVVIEISANVLSGNLTEKFPPDEFVMYSKSSPGCGYYYIGGRLVYK